MGFFFGGRRYSLAAALFGLAMLISACSSEQLGVAGGSDAESTSTVVPSDLASGQGALATDTTMPAPEPVEASVPEVVSDVGIDDETIRVGYSLDLSGPLSAYDAVLLDGHLARFAQVNAEGGVAGRTVEVVAFDNAGDLGIHQGNIASLAASSESGVVAIGALSHPKFDQVTATALDASALLTIGNQTFRSGDESVAPIVSLRPAVCVETATGVAALADSNSNAGAQLAILSSDEDWAQESAVVARSAAGALELEVVLDRVFDADAQGEGLADFVEGLRSVEPDLVWVVGSPPFLSGLANELATLEDPPSWVWGGPSANVASAVFDALSGPSLADVYQVTAAGALIDDVMSSSARAALAAFAPELSYADAAPALLGWEQAGLLVEALERSASTGDLSRSALVSAGRQLVPEIGDVGVYRIELVSERNNILSIAGSLGTELLFTETEVPSAVANLCS